MQKYSTLLTRLKYGMPTERERDSYNPEIKDEHTPGRRLRFLDHSVPDVGSVLALYGLYSLFF